MGVLYIGLGGAIGALARYGLTGWIHDRAGASFPWGTMVVNLSGSFLLGFALAYLQATSLTSEVRQFIGIGLLGGFTTFSTFMYETAVLLRDGEWYRGGAYAAGTLFLGLIAVFAGLAVASVLLERG